MPTIRALTIGSLLAFSTSAWATDPPSLRATHYDVRIIVDYKESKIDAAVAMTLQNVAVQPVSATSLLLYRLMTVRSITLANGTAVSFTQTVRALDDSPRQQVNYIELQLPMPLRPRESVVLHVAYDGYLAGYVETGMMYIRDRVHKEFTILRPDAKAFPEVGTLSNRANYSVGRPDFRYEARITVPQGYVVANGGALIDTSTTGNAKTFRYRSYGQAWRMDFAIAPYGVLETDAFRVFYLPGDSAAASTLAAAAAQTMQIYSSWFGPLREKQVFSLIEIPDGFGSQADVTAILQTAAAFRDSSQVNQLYHELAHLWLPLREPMSPRFDEGMATFLEYQTAARLNGNRNVADEFTKAVVKLQSWIKDRPEFATVPMRDYGQKGWTGLSYPVGFLMSSVLHELVGPERFNKIIRDYYAKNGGDTEAFVKTASESAGRNLQPFFQDWLYTTRWVELISEKPSAATLAAAY